MSKARYIAIRSVQTVFFLWLVLTFLFFFFRAMPGDYADLLMFSGASQETVNAIRQQWGLNDPLHVQYIRFILNYLTLDGGQSLQYRVPVWEHVALRIFNSLILVAPAITVGYLIGAIIGLVAGTNRGGVFEEYGLIPFIVFGAFPDFFLAILVIIIFAGVLGIFPTSGMVSPLVRSEMASLPWWRIYFTPDFLMHYILPFSTIVLRYIYVPSLVTRTSVVETLGQGFIDYHRLTGIRKFDRLKYIAKHSSLPVITIYPISLTQAIGGLVLVEIVFNWPGIGFTLVEAVFSRDIPVIQFVFFLVATYIIIANFAVDLLYGIIDPRVSIEGSE